MLGSLAGCQPAAAPQRRPGVSGGTGDLDAAAAAGAAHNGVRTPVCQRVAKSPSNSAPASALKDPLCAFAIYAGVGKQNGADQNH
jgi:hypothetical protein